ncbi:MAG: hypothetical protein AAF911_13545 [Planctomycetota bacterium]
MAKQDPATAKKFAALLKKCLSAYKGEDPPPRDPVAQLIVSFMQWDATRKQAEDAFVALMEEMIDVNDLRVSHPHELVAVVGEDYPNGTIRMIRLRESLHEVYAREHDIQMHSIAGKGKKEQRAYLDSLPGIAPFVAAQVTLLSFGGHAMPIDDKLLALLIGEGCLDEGTSVEDAESYLLRQIKAGDALEAHLALQAWADKRKSPTAKSAPKTTKKTTKAPAKKAPAKKVSKSTKKKTTKKKTTKKKVAKKK